MTENSPVNECGAGWQEAAQRLREYLQALGIQASKDQNRILSAVLERAAMKFEEDRGLSAVAVAMNEFRTMVEEWIAGLTGGRKQAANGELLACLFATEALEKWPEAFLADEIPAGFREALQSCDLRAAPQLQVASMVPQPFANPLEDVKLPRPLEELAKELAPYVSKVFSFMSVGIFFGWTWFNFP